MATSYKLLLNGHGVSGETINLTVGVYPATVDPTAKDANGAPLNQPVDQIEVSGTLADTPATWEARATAAFAEWCRIRSQQAIAATALATWGATVLTVTDPTGN
jgi:hypothetical protein